MKTIAVEVLLPDVLAHRAIQTARGKGTRISIALARAINEILDREGVKGKRIRRGKINFAIVDDGGSTKTEERA